MEFIPLTDPFTLRFNNNGVTYEATVLYAKSLDCFNHFFDITMQTPEGMRCFHLKEKPHLNPGSETIIWIDQNDHVKMLYQVLGNEIQQYLRKHLGILLIDAPIVQKQGKKYEI